MNKVFLSLGSNLGNRKENLSKAIRYINEELGHLVDVSGIYESEPWGFESSEYFLNMVVEILTSLPPETLLKQCKSIEGRMGREISRTKGYSSRIIDIDILFYDNVIVSEPELTIPHPHIHMRRFILEPLNDLAPDYVHPMLGLTVNEILDQCSDDLQVMQIGGLN